MKTKFKSNILKLLGRIFDVRYWFDWSRVRAFTLYLYEGFQRLFIPRKQATTQSFKQATKALDLDEQALLIKQKALLRLSILMVVIAALIFAYTLYQLLYGSFHATMASFVVMLIALTLAFRYHFWYFQIKHRKLGCTIKEWLHQGLLGEKK